MPPYIPWLYLSPDQGGGGSGMGSPQQPVDPAAAPLPASSPQSAPPLVPTSQAFGAGFDALQNQQPRQPAAQRPGTESIEARFTRLMDSFEELQARRSGLDRRFTTVDQRLNELSEQLQALTNGTQAPASPPDAQRSEPQPPGEPTPAQAAPEIVEMQTTLRQLQAQQERNRAIREVASDFPGLDLWQWEENIPLRPGDPTAQREAVTAVAQRLQSQLAGTAQQAANQRQQALTQGMTPGSSPSPPLPAEEEGFQRTRDIWELMNDTPRWLALEPEQRQAFEEEFDRLSEDYGHAIGDGYRPGWANMQDVMSRIHGIERSLRNSGAMGVQQAQPGQTPTMPMPG